MTSNSPRDLANLEPTLLEHEPRERLLEHGSASLSDSELLSILVRNGNSADEAHRLAQEVLTDHGGLPGLIGLSPHDLFREGLRHAKAAVVLAAVELARRFARREVAERRALGRPGAVASYLRLRYCLPDQEVMGALYVDTRKRLLSDRELYRGTLRRAAVEPRQVLKEALRINAAGLILFHTHPSGDPSPSPQDLSFTRRMHDAAEILGVSLEDHLIVGASGRWVSLRARGAF